MTLKTYLAEIYAVDRQLTLASRKIYLANLARFNVFLDRPATFNDCDVQTVRQFTNWANERHYAQSTINATLETLIALVRHRQHHELPQLESATPVELESLPSLQPAT